jgi:GPH family glycoside/pentoside/hexuronide:cation symporter
VKISNNSQEISLSQSLIYLAGQFGGNILNLIFVTWIMRFYLLERKGEPPLLTAGFLGISLVIGRIIDAIADPIVGYWTDNAKTKFGRRKPFIIFGSPLLVLFFLLLFTPLFPANSLSLKISTVILMSLFWFSFTVVMVPYLALLPEITFSPIVRVRLSTLMAVAMMLSQAVGGILAPQVIEKFGFSSMALIFGITSLIFLYITGIFIKEKYQPSPQLENFGFLKSFYRVLKNPAFLIYIITSLTLTIGFASLMSSLALINKVILKRPDSFMTILFIICGGFIGIGFFLINLLVKKYKKSKIYLFSLLSFSIFFPFLFILGRVNLPISDVSFIFIIIGVLSLPIAAHLSLPMAILSDIIDYDSKISGIRSEGIYFSSQGFLQKLATAISMGMMGLLFQYFGCKEGNHLGINLLGPICGILSFIGYLVFRKYPLEKENINEKEIDNDRDRWCK